LLNKGDVIARSLYQEQDGPLLKFRVAVVLETTEMRLKADEVDYDQEKEYAEARGNVSFEHFVGGERIFADKVEYWIGEERALYYNVRGSAPAKIEARPGVLTTTNPFSFEGRWAERIKNRYILHEGFITNCRLPRPWWRLTGPKFDVIPGQRALAYNAVFRVRFVPIFFTPIFYKSLERLPRKSGFLTPNIGNSSRRGKMFGAGYYWAINRSYDATYRAQYFTQRGFAHHVDVRGKPWAGADFNAVLYGVNDRGLPVQQFVEVSPGVFEQRQVRRKEGGLIASFDGRAALPKGFEARAEVNYLSSLTFRQAFTETFSEAVFSEVHSNGFITKHWSTFGFTLLFNRNENFQSTLPGDKIVIRRLPQFEFRSYQREVSRKVLPLWLSLDSIAGFVRRDQPLFQTRQYMERMEFAPRLTTALRWKDFHIIPSFGIRETHWGEQFLDGRVVGRNFNRHARDVAVEVVAPSLERIFQGRLKHVIEPRAAFRHVSGVADFESLIRFDETELLSNTTEAELSLTNRFFLKSPAGVREIFGWQLWQKRYFDPDLGGAVKTGSINVAQTSATLTAYSFFDRPRRYSPIISVLRANPTPRFGMEWRADYDPFRGKVLNSGVSADVRTGPYFVSIGHARVSCTPVVELTAGLPCQDPRVLKLSPPANQMRGIVGYGNESRRGWSAGFSAIYDFRTSTMQYSTTQVTYNTDCCGISFQYRRFSFGTRNENQFRVAFAVANIGSFGTLKKQERLF
jgi:LPS-assembly protein